MFRQKHLFGQQTTNLNKTQYSDSTVHIYVYNYSKYQFHLFNLNDISKAIPIICFVVQNNLTNCYLFLKLLFFMHANKFLL